MSKSKQNLLKTVERNKVGHTLAEEILKRSDCAVQVGAVLIDSEGIQGIGWNGMGPTGMGIHAEHHCILRSNRKRWGKSTLYVAARRRKSRNPVTAKPCPDCQRVIRKIGRVVYREKDGEWCEL